MKTLKEFEEECREVFTGLGVARESTVDKEYTITNPYGTVYYNPDGIGPSYRRDVWGVDLHTGSGQHVYGFGPSLQEACDDLDRACETAMREKRHEASQLELQRAVIEAARHGFAHYRAML